MINKFNFNKGFSLVEVLIAAFIFSAVTIVLTGFFISGIRSYTRNNVAYRTQDAARLAFESLTRDIIPSLITSADTLGCLPFNGWALNLVHQDSGATITYHLTSGVLYRNGISIMPADVEISSMQVCISSYTLNGSGRPTKITMLTTFRSKSLPDYKFDLQTTVTERVIGNLKLKLRES